MDVGGCGRRDSASRTAWTGVSLLRLLGMLWQDGWAERNGGILQLKFAPALASCPSGNAWWLHVRLRFGEAFNSSLGFPGEGPPQTLKISTLNVTAWSSWVEAAPREEAAADLWLLQEHKIADRCKIAEAKRSLAARVGPRPFLRRSSLRLAAAAAGRLLRSASTPRSLRSCRCLPAWATGPLA